MNRLRAPLIALLSLLGPLLLCPPASASALEALQAGRPQEAWSILEKAPDLRTEPVRAYQAGLVLLQLGNPGAAYAYFARAARQRPWDSDFAHNEALARGALVQQLGQERLDPASSLWEKLEALLHPRLALWESLAALLLLLGVLRARELRLQLRWALVLGSLVLGLEAMRLGLGVDAPAVALEPATLRSGPSDSYVELGRLVPGMRIRFTGRSTQDAQSVVWHQVRFSSDGIAWMRESGLLLL